MRVYLDNAATTQIAPEVIDYMAELMKSDYANPSSIHHGGRKSRILVENARKIVSNYLNTSPGNIFFTSGGTEADNMFITNTVLENFELWHDACVNNQDYPITPEEMMANIEIFEAIVKSGETGEIVDI